MVPDLDFLGSCYCDVVSTGIHALLLQLFATWSLLPCSSGATHNWQEYDDIFEYFLMMITIMSMLVNDIDENDGNGQ